MPKDRPEEGLTPFVKLCIAVSLLIIIVPSLTILFVHSENAKALRQLEKEAHERGEPFTAEELNEWYKFL